ncbi:RDD family protein [Acidicapsa ligni]|uniref:RDD family protein n=1 Tax=Acidicapsa ligni TaxID=542300 RepID=UPI0021E023CE|nr:RDD family protein [Acidicapsa ligni]
MSNSASLPAENFEPFELRSYDPQARTDSHPHAAGTPAWKQEVNQRLAAHRTRRGGAQNAASNDAAESPRAASSRAAQAAARVAERYAKAPSYSQLLAGEARAVVRAAGAAAEAARNAQAAAQAVLFGLEAGLESEHLNAGVWEPTPQISESNIVQNEHVPPVRWEDTVPEPVYVAQAQQVAEAPKKVQQNAWAGAQPRWEEALPAPGAGRDAWSEMRVHPTAESHPRYGGHVSGHVQAQEMDEADPYPHDLMASAMVEPVQHIPANLIEFPRELVATRKARPRLAEGPFYDASHENSQLSIFEVDPELLAPPVAISDSPAGAVAPPEWASIELDRAPHVGYGEHEHAEQYSTEQYPAEYHTAEHYPVDPYYGGERYTAHETNRGYADAYSEAGVVESYPETAYAEAAVAEARSAQAASAARVRPVAAAALTPVELQVAPMGDRLLAGVVDAALVTLAFLAAAVVVVASTDHPPAGRIALIATGCGLALFGLLYQFLFLSYAEEGTPGMRYARIALCSFNDDNPSREQMRTRIPAMLLSGLPLGIGLLWALIDKDHLCWHDRLTKTYQRKY